MLRNIICILYLLLNIESVSSVSIKRPPTDYICPEVKCSGNCPRGYTYDIHGCNTCECKPTSIIEPISCGPVCKIGCIYWNVLDAHGCPTCHCKPKSFQTVVGKCPKSSKSNIECPTKLSHSCDTDYDCSGGKKCCTFGCTRKCIYPKHGPLIYPPACGRVCFISCPYGKVVDSRGCETCRCKPKPRPRPIPYPCPRIMCPLRHCDHVGAPSIDRHGCPTCGCR
ncbi:antistasin-like isoform X2 [Mytilus californianus]|uniref:antistasin-like isoform X1 n=1 Tax=Mytilus californianus TaxID=6549 RepID=UPI002245FA4C|nr:antistasin-like isoform X1 [Mytilus californianus]XP_052097564.1 antistasin-like isoform X2 [Mytilus californianus]